MSIVQLGIEALDDSALLAKLVTLEGFEELEDALGSGCGARPLLGIEREVVETACAHGAAHLALEQCVDRKRPMNRIVV